MGFFRRSNNKTDASAPSSDVDTQQFLQQAETLIPAEIRLISGCHSDQTSADVANVSRIAKLPDPAGRSGGACTSALLEILYATPEITFQEVLLKLRNALAARGLSQIPQLSSSRPLELEQTPFRLAAEGNGQRRALLVGINYRGQSGELSGCHNDVLNVKKYLMRYQGFPEHNILMVMDKNTDGIMPTRQKIILGLQQLVRMSKPGDSAYFHFSGHGGLLDPQGFNPFKAVSGEYDETLYPLDHSRAGQIRDFSLFNHFVKPLAAGVTCTAVIDACHSGEVLKLPYSFQPTSRNTIRMRQSMDNLSNLAFLYFLAGGLFPPGFGNVTSHLEDSLGGDLDGYQGTQVEEMTEADAFDDSAFQEAYDSGAYDTGENYDGTDQDYGGEEAYDNAGGDAFNSSENYNVVDGQDVEPAMYGDSNYGDAARDVGGYDTGDAGGGNVFGGGNDGDCGGGESADCGGCGEGIGDILGALLDGAGDM